MLDRYYLAYGSNLNSRIFNSFCPKSKKIGSMYLEGYRLAFKGLNDGHGYLTILEDQTKNVPIGIYKISLFDMKELDKYEGYPTLYQKKSVVINIGSKKVKAYIYVMNDGYDYHTPSKAYFNVCLKGYREFNFNTSYLYQALSVYENKKQK